VRCIGVGWAVCQQGAPASPKKKACARQAQVEEQNVHTRLPSCQMRQCQVLQWLCELRCAQAVVRFSTQLNSSYMAMAMAPTTSKPAKASPICMEEPAEISK
jgi:hypothetical protein